MIKTGYTLDTSNSYCKISLACLNISLFKWHYFHHNSSGKVVSDVKQESRSSFCPEKANPAGDEHPTSLPCQMHQEGAARKTQQQQQHRSPRKSSQEKLDGLPNSPKAAVQVRLTLRLPPHCR